MKKIFMLIYIIGILLNVMLIIIFFLLLLNSLIGIYGKSLENNKIFKFFSEIGNCIFIKNVVEIGDWKIDLIFLFVLLIADFVAILFILKYIRNKKIFFLLFNIFIEIAGLYIFFNITTLINLPYFIP